MAKTTDAEVELRLRLVLEAPPAGVDFGLQSGKGNDYEVIQKQRSQGGDISFDCAITVKNNRADGLPNFLGPLTQGSPPERFVYIDVGRYAGQQHAVWARRIKIPLAGISWALIEKADGSMLEARLPGTGKDGGPICATHRPAKWTLVKAKD